MVVNYKKFIDEAGILVTRKGDWIDVYQPARVELKEGEYKAIPLGIGIKLPIGYEAIASPRSSTFKNHGLLVVNSPCVIDQTYSGDNDQWHVLVYATQDCVIDQGDRILQFRLQLNQFATRWQKIKHLFFNKMEFKLVKSFNNNKNRGGVGSTGK